jgi:hypothetical protein
VRIGIHSESRVSTNKWKKTTGTVVHLESHVRTEWENTHFLPSIILVLSMSEDFDNLYSQDIDHDDLNSGVGREKDEICQTLSTGT